MPRTIDFTADLQRYFNDPDFTGDDASGVFDYFMQLIQEVEQSMSFALRRPLVPPFDFWEPLTSLGDSCSFLPRSICQLHLSSQTSLGGPAASPDLVCLCEGAAAPFAPLH